MLVNPSGCAKSPLLISYKGAINKREFLKEVLLPVSVVNETMLTVLVLIVCIILGPPSGSSGYVARSVIQHSFNCHQPSRV